MFEKYLKLIQTHQNNQKEIRGYLDNLGFKNIMFNIDGENVDFIIPSAFKLRIHNKKQEIIDFLKSKNLKAKNL